MSLILEPLSFELMTVEEKWQAQSMILRSTYNEEYPTSVNSAEDSIYQIKANIQEVLFWGESLEELKNWEWWTISIVKSSIFWDWIVEMCRAWSTKSTWKWTVAVYKLFEHYQLNSEYWEMFATTRNCSDREDENNKLIKGGTSIYNIFEKLPFKIWWIAPWYIMPSKELELLDLRVHIKNNELREMLTAGQRIYINNSKYADIISKMLANNFELSPDSLKIEIWVGDNYLQESSELINKFQNYKIYKEKNEKIRKFTSSFIYPDSDCNFKKIRDILDDANKCDSGISNFVIDLFNPEHIYLQKFIENEGYVFTSLFPADDKISWIWTKTEHAKIAQPFYYDNTEEISDNISLVLQKEIIFNFLRNK